MKPTRLFSKINFTVLALAALVATTLLFAGCTTTDSGSSDHSAHQGSSCH